MRHCWPLILLLVLPGDTHTADARGIEIPKPIVVPTPPPMPAPAPPGTVGKLNRGELFVMQDAKPFFVKQVGTGKMAFENMEGPVTIYAQFAYGGGKFEKKTFAGKYVTIGSGETTGQVSLVVVPTTVEKEADIVIETVDVDAGAGPQPPPPPVPPTPDPDAKYIEAIKTAYTADPDPNKSANARQLAALYEQAARVTVNDKAITNWGQWFNVNKSARVSLIGDGLGVVRKAIANAIFDVRWPANADAVFDDAARKGAAESLLLAAKCLRAVQ